MAQAGAACIVAVLLALSVGNAIGIRVEKNGQISDALKSAYKRVQLASASLVAGQHGEMQDLASMKRVVPSGPNGMVPSPGVEQVRAKKPT